MGVTCLRSLPNDVLTKAMLSVLFILLVGLCSCHAENDAQCAKGLYPPNKQKQVPRYVINLDAAPSERWHSLAAQYKDQISYMLNTLKNVTGRYIGRALFSLIDYFGPHLEKSLPSPFREELSGIANATGIPLGEITIYNLFYEVFTVCTSIIIEDFKNVLYHGRNLDFGLFLGWDSKNHTWLLAEALRPLIVELDFQRGGQTVFRSVNFVGYVGILTAVKPNLFSLSMNERFDWEGGYVGILEWLMGYRKESWMGFLTRSVMENSTSYTQAQKMLAKTPLLAPAYFILGGNGSHQASVITRWLDKFDILQLGYGPEPWFLVETNYDHWKRAPIFDNRRKPAIDCLNEGGRQNASFALLFNVLSTRPVLNKETTYTALMQVNEGTLETYLQYCDDPCPLW